MSAILTLLVAPTIFTGAFAVDSHMASNRHSNSVSFCMRVRIASEAGVPWVRRSENSAACTVRHCTMRCSHRLVAQGGVFVVTVGVRAASLAEGGLTGDVPFDGAIRR